METCISCGMPLENTEDFALCDPTKNYCRYCARPDGSMQSYEERLEGMTAFLMETQGLDESAARNAARESMAKLPAWLSR